MHHPRDKKHALSTTFYIGLYEKLTSRDPKWPGRVEERHEEMFQDCVLLKSRPNGRELSKIFVK